MKLHKVITVYVDGAGADPNGLSGFAWLREGGQKHAEWGRGWTNNEAEYRAVLAALQALPHGACAEILTDSALVFGQLHKGWQIREPRLCNLVEDIRKVISGRGLQITWRWIPRAENRADGLLRQKPRSNGGGSKGNGLAK